MCFPEFRGNEIVENGYAPLVYVSDGSSRPQAHIDIKAFSLTLTHTDTHTHTHDK